MKERFEKHTLASKNHLLIAVIFLVLFGTFSIASGQRMKIDASIFPMDANLILENQDVTKIKFYLEADPLEAALSADRQSVSAVLPEKPSKSAKPIPVLEALHLNYCSIAASEGLGADTVFSPRLSIRTGNSSADIAEIRLSVQKKGSNFGAILLWSEKTKAVKISAICGGANGKEVKAHLRLSQGWNFLSVSPSANGFEFFVESNPSLVFNLISKQ